jgi:geranyl-CoA carboxylase alpha subunit
VSFEKILIANRGEIACRVIQTAQELGYRTVAVYAQPDAGARHVVLADEAVCIGPATASASYLNIDAVIDACQRTGADAVHPGYGFLSENAEFARACSAANITFIGPPVDAIHLMGSKRLSKIAMLDADVPCIPGYQGEAQDDATLLAEAGRIGLPLMIKASAGGGGRGMRVVTDSGDIAEQLRSARSEAKNAFGSDELILERAVINPRHVEIQVFADCHGNVIHLGERDCSIQRRHQKVVEEAPSPAVDPALRERMGEAAVNAARACQYVGAGTVEFLLADNGDFFFLEMNTRLQVEHPVTEMITGLDLVAWQIRVARGEPLPLEQTQVRLDGHAIEVRLYAEDPAQDFMPQTGTVVRWQPAHGAGVRIDHGLVPGYTVSSHYDPMLAKVIAWGENREDARRRLIRAVEDTRLAGVNDNRRFLAAVLRHPVFARGEATTAFLAEHFADDPTLRPATPAARDWALAAALLCHDHAGAGWSSSAHATFALELAHGDSRQSVSLVRHGNDFDIRIGEQALTVCLQPERVTIDGIQQALTFTRQERSVHIERAGITLAIHDATHDAPDLEGAAGSGAVKAPMDGAVLDVRCSVGDSVTRGQVLAVMEAMKMEHSLVAPMDGEITAVNVETGSQVKGKQTLMVVSCPDGDPDAR